MKQPLKKSYLVHAQSKKGSFQPQRHGYWCGVSLSTKKPSQLPRRAFCQSNRFSKSHRSVWSRRETALTVPYWHIGWPGWKGACPSAARLVLAALHSALAGWCTRGQTGKSPANLYESSFNISEDRLSAELLDFLDLVQEIGVFFRYLLQ